MMRVMKQYVDDTHPIEVPLQRALWQLRDCYETPLAALSGATEACPVRTHWAYYWPVPEEVPS